MKSMLQLPAESKCNGKKWTKKANDWRLKINSLTRICSKKCVPGDYREGELNKGESVCLDRCSSKFFEAWMKTSDVMMKFSEQMGTGAAGGTGGFPKMD